jgi:hypothetical protein
MRVQRLVMCFWKREVPPPTVERNAVRVVPGVCVCSSGDTFLHELYTALREGPESNP